MRYDIHYVTNEQLWKMESTAKKAGFKKEAECYWTQIFTNGADTIVTIREDAGAVLGDPVARFNAIVNPAPAAQEPALEPAQEPAHKEKKPVARINSDAAITKAISNCKSYVSDHYADGVAIHISAGNTKLGAIANISLPPVATCHNCSSCKKYCYAVRSYNRFTGTAAGWNENYLYFLTDPAGYFDDISDAVKTQRFFRWHVSGDIVNAKYLSGMIRVARENPHCEFLAFTKAYGIVNTAIGSGSIIPGNLHLLFSAAPGNKMPNPFKIPECHINFADPALNTYCGGAAFEYHCTGNCTECAVNGCGCFFLKPGDVTIINQH